MEVDSEVTEVLLQLKALGIPEPELAIGDGVLG